MEMLGLDISALRVLLRGALIDCIPGEFDVDRVRGHDRANIAGIWSRA